MGFASSNSRHEILEAIFGAVAENEQEGYNVLRRFYSDRKGRGPGYRKVLWAIKVIQESVRARREKRKPQFPSEEFFCQRRPIYRANRRP